MLGRDALVAEVLAELVDALDPADDQPLEVQLGGDAQVEVAVELVVVGRERARQRAAVERLQHRRLDLEEALAVELAADGGDHARACGKAARLVGGDQVQLAPAVAGLDVVRPWCLSGGGRSALASSVQGVDAQRELAAPGREDRAVDAEHVAEVEPDEQLERSAPSTSRRACSWIRPVRSTRSRKAARPWPRRAAMRPATR